MLSKLLQKAKEINKLKGIKLAKGCQPISHLQFVDDLFIFGRADEENIRSIKEFLSTYSSCSRQKINTNKSTMVFSKNLISWHSKHLLVRSRTEHRLGQLDPPNLTRRVLGGLNGCLGRVWVQYSGLSWVWVGFGSNPTQPILKK